MNSEIRQQRIQQEIQTFIQSRKSLQLATMNEDKTPYASYAPFALGDECLYVLLSEIAVHAKNLQHSPNASVLIIQDEDNSDELFARLRVHYSVQAEQLELNSEDGIVGINMLAARHGERINVLSELSDFKLFKLTPESGLFIKGFGRAFQINGHSLTGSSVDHMRDNHKKRTAA